MRDRADTGSVEVFTSDQKATFGDHLNDTGELVKGLASQFANVFGITPRVLIKVN